MTKKEKSTQANVERLELGVHYENYKWAIKHLRQLAEVFPEIKGTEYYDELLADLVGGEKMALAQLNYGPLYMTGVYRRNKWDAKWAEDRDSNWNEDVRLKA